MSKRDDQVSLEEMFDHAREAVKLLEELDYHELENDRVLQLAITRLIEILGEAANRVSCETQQRYTEIPWMQIIGMRNRLIHGYDFVDYSILWDTVRVDFPPLIIELERILGYLEGG